MSKAKEIEDLKEITKVSEITAKDLANYINIYEPSEKELIDLNTNLSVAKSYIKNYTGQKDLDIHVDFIIVIYILCQDMYDNRTLYIEKGSVNETVKTILDMHSINLL